MLRFLRFALLLACGIVLMSYLKPASAPPVDPVSLDRCPVPGNLTVSNVTDSSAQLSWFASDSALSVDLQWREAGDLDWVTVPNVSSPYTLPDLTPCIVYELRLQAHCNGSDSDFSSVILFEADGCCRIPSYLHLISSTETSARIGWDAVSFAFAHPVRYKALDDDEWIQLETDTNVINIPSLEPCTAYEIQVGSQCDLITTEYSTSLEFGTVDCGACTDLNYCSAAGDDASSEWIDSIAFGALRYQSGSNDGYLLRNTLQTGIERKRPYTFHLKPASTIPGASFYLRMWIDLNQDGIFTDSTELLVDPPTSISAAGWTQTLVIQDSVMLGQTRMRVILKSVIDMDTIRPSACGSFLFGEVEDYCISIDDVCPEVQPALASATETSAVISWAPVTESIVFIYRHRKVGDTNFSEPELTQDTIVEITDLEKCNEYQLQTLNVCVQDTSSWQDFFFETECPDAVHDILPVADDVNVYPNPFTDQITLTLSPVISGNASLKLLNLFGMEVTSRMVTIRENETQSIQFDALDDLHHGMYLLYLEVENRRQIFKVVK